MQFSKESQEVLLSTLKVRFEKNMKRHASLNWDDIQSKLENNISKLWSLHEMERTGGEPDVVQYISEKDQYLFYDCSEESPKGRRSLCYDRESLNSRKENKPETSVLDMAAEFGIELFTEDDYRMLQKLGKFDAKTSSWIQTPVDIRKLGGALFADYRYGTIFVYHNGAESYYAARGFRGKLTL